MDSARTCGPELNHAHVCRAGYSVEALSARRRSGGERKYSAVITADSEARKTRARVVKLFGAAFIAARE